MRSTSAAAEDYCPRQVHAPPHSHPVVNLSLHCLQSLARLGAQTLAIDASASNINIASLHASADPHLARALEYRCTAAENLLSEDAPSPKQYDVVCSMEVLEHVDHPQVFLRTLGDLVKVRTFTTQVTIPAL